MGVFSRRSRPFLGELHHMRPRHDAGRVNDGERAAAAAKGVVSWGPPRTLG